MRDYVATTSDVILQVVRKHLHDFILVDRTFKVELSIIESLAGPDSEARLLTAIEQCFPTHDKEVDVATVLQRVAQLKTAAVYKFASQTTQGKLATTEKILAQIDISDKIDISEFIRDKALVNIITICSISLNSC